MYVYIYIYIRFRSHFGSTVSSRAQPRPHSACCPLSPWQADSRRAPSFPCSGAHSGAGKSTLPWRLSRCGPELLRLISDFVLVEAECFHAGCPNGRLEQVEFERDLTFSTCAWKLPAAGFLPPMVQQRLTLPFSAHPAMMLDEATLFVKCDEAVRAWR